MDLSVLPVEIGDYIASCELPVIICKLLGSALDSLRHLAAHLAPGGKPLLQSDDSQRLQVEPAFGIIVDQRVSCMHRKQGQCNIRHARRAMMEREDFRDRIWKPPKPQKIGPDFGVAGAENCLLGFADRNFLMAGSPENRSVMRGLRRS